LVMSGYAASMVRSHERLRRVIGQESLGRGPRKGRKGRKGRKRLKRHGWKHGWEPGRAAPATERNGGEKR